MKTFVFTFCICYVYTWRFWDFWVKTLRRKYCGGWIRTGVGWKIELIPQKTSFKTHSLWGWIIVWDVSEFFCIFPAWLKFRFPQCKNDEFWIFWSGNWGVVLTGPAGFYHFESCLGPFIKCFCVLWNRLEFIFEDFCFDFFHLPCICMAILRFWPRYT